MIRVLMLVSLAACFPSKRSDNFECSTTDQCNDGRVCDRGYCVFDGEPPNDSKRPDANDCPPQCTSCNKATMQCDVLCSQGNSCNSVSCPAGYHCTFTCSASGSCDNISCADALDCTIQCNGQQSCSSITCGPGRCDVTCGGTNSCDIVDCQSSCQCDVSCAAGATCNTSCPPAMTVPMKCTQDGTDQTECDSTFEATCQSC